MIFSIVSLLAVSVVADSCPAPPPPVRQSPIKNLIILMLENRSFDSFLGRLKWDGINPKVNGLTGNEFNFDPEHGVNNVTRQIFGTTTHNAAGLKPTMSGFAADAFADEQSIGDAQYVFGAFGPDTIPVTYALAQEFSIVEDWFGEM
eukprot:jgi/Hompol1/3962/HPOL_006851-RA